MKNKEPRVLILDDDYTDARWLAGELRKAEFQTHVVSSAKEALVEAKNKYDVVILDLNLNSVQAEPSGSEMLEELRRFSPKTKFVLYTRYTDRLAVDPVHGADIIVRKPAIDEPDGLQLAELLSDRLSTAERPTVELSPELVLPVRRVISATNRRLLEIFGREPELLRSLDPFTFEEVVAELFEREGYQVILTPQRKDGGKDIYVFRRDPITQTIFLVECKKYSPPHKVGVSVARQLYGVVQSERATGGIIATTSYFTDEAENFAKTTPYQLYLRDFDDLTLWIKRILRSSKGAASNTRIAADGLRRR
jgi:CheY-like chemotaxis protein